MPKWKQKSGERRNAYIAIMIASEKGVGVRLTPDEVLKLSLDDAISTHAFNVMTNDEFVIDD